MTAPPNRTSSAGSLGRCKGAALRELALWFERERGLPELRARVASLAPEQRVVFDAEREALGVVTSTWYPLEPVHALLDALTRELPPAARSATADHVAQAVLGSTLRGVHRMLFEMLATPVRYVRHAQRLWDANYDTGQLEARLIGPREAESRVTGFSGHHPFICEMQRASAEVIYRAMRCRNARTARLSCVSEGAAACVFRTSWDG